MVGLACGGSSCAQTMGSSAEAVNTLRTRRWSSSIQYTLETNAIVRVLACNAPFNGSSGKRSTGAASPAVKPSGPIRPTRTFVFGSYRSMIRACTSRNEIVLNCTLGGATARSARIARAGASVAAAHGRGVGPGDQAIVEQRPL